jgi:hypothetical protein
MENTSTVSPVSAAAPLGVAGFTFADLHEPERLASLYERFCEEMQASDPVFWEDWDAYRQNPDRPRSPLELSALLVGMAPHVSRFLTRLFQVGADAAAIDQATRNQDDLFRFKVDFVRRRALPLLKGGVRVTSTPHDEAVVDGMCPPEAGPDADRELAVARAGCLLMDREKAGDVSAEVKSQVESLRRWCAARVHERAYRNWVVFRFPENLDYWCLVDVQRPSPRSQSRCSAPTTASGGTMASAHRHPDDPPGAQRFTACWPRARQGLLFEGLFEPAAGTQAHVTPGRVRSCRASSP